MDEFKIYIKAGFMAAIGFFEYLVGGIDNCIKTLLIFMVVDVLTGIRKAAMGHSEKSVKGYLDSEVMWKGGIKKTNDNSGNICCCYYKDKTNRSSRQLQRRKRQKEIKS